MVTCRIIAKTIERLAPKALSEEWDNTGLQVGDPERPVERVLVSLDITDEVLDEAISLGVDMIISHHPVLFKPQKSIRNDNPVGRILRRAIQKGIDIYACHTNADSCFQGVNDWLAQRLGLQNTQVLQLSASKLFKVVVFVPEGYEGAIREELGKAGAGWLGNYSHCSFMARGTGSFKPLEGANPFVGIPGKLEEVPEYRIETVVPDYLLQKTVKRMLEVHPYEEVAYDIYPVENKEQRHGLGRIGNLEAPLTLRALAKKIRDELECRWVTVIGEPDSEVQRVAVLGGSGGSMVGLAKTKKAEVLVTGDIKYHEALEAKLLGLNVIDAGHNATERVFIPLLTKYLEEELNKGGKGITILASKVNTDPWTFVIG